MTTGDWMFTGLVIFLVFIMIAQRWPWDRDDW